MYAIFEKETGKRICGNMQLTTPKKAWEYFKAHHFDLLRDRPDGTRMRLAKGDQHYSNFFECKLEGTRAPVLRVPGHKLTVTWSGERGREASSTGVCTCGWTESCSSQSEVRNEFRHHLKSLSGTDLTPKPAARLAPNDRVKQSLDRLKDSGGDRKTFRLRAPAIDALTELVESKQYPNETAAVEVALQNLRRPTMSRASLYPIHVESPEVQSVVQAAVMAACSELDTLFPGAKAEVNGVSSNFAGLLEEHMKALLRGLPGHVHTTLVELNPLLADDTVFGQPFELPQVQGCGYMAVDDVDGKVLSAYSGRFINIIKPVSWNKPQVVRHEEEADVLFHSHEAAVKAALAALKEEDYSPADRKVRIVAAAWDENLQQFAEVSLSSAK